MVKFWIVRGPARGAHYSQPKRGRFSSLEDARAEAVTRSAGHVDKGNFYVMEAVLVASDGEWEEIQ